MYEGKIFYPAHMEINFPYKVPMLAAQEWLWFFDTILIIW